MKKVYLDQCVVSHLCQDPKVPWHETKFGAVLKRAIERSQIEVWPSPTNVLETLMCADYGPDGKLIPSNKTAKRQQLARTLLDLGQGKRMFPSFEFLLVREFLEFLRQLAPRCIRTDRIFKMLERINQERFLGILALLAAYPELDRPAAIETILRSKVSTQLLHSRFGCDPEKYVTQLIDCAREFRLTSDDVWKDYDSRSLSELTDEIDRNCQAVRKLSPAAKKSLQKNKQAIADSYGAAEIGACLNSVFEDFYLLLMTFDIYALKEAWNDICGRINKSVSMPDALRKADEAGCSEETVAAEAISHFFRQVAHGELPSPGIVNQIVIGELEICLNNEEIPTGGLGFDAEHAAVLNHVHVFATTDTRLENLAKRAANMISKATGGQWTTAVVSNADQLERAIC